MRQAGERSPHPELSGIGRKLPGIFRRSKKKWALCAYIKNIAKSFLLNTLTLFNIHDNLDSDESRVQFTVTKSALCLDLISHTTEKNSDEIVLWLGRIRYGNSNELKKKDYSFQGRLIQYYCLVYFSIIIWFIFPLSHSCDHQNKFLVL